jgi:hypothetical protein
MWVEKTEKRTQKSKTFYDVDTNKYKTELGIHDKHFKDENNNWIDVDENFENGGVHTKKCDKTRHAIHIANGGARRWYPRRNITTEYVDITNIEYYLNQWRNLNLPTPAWTNNKTEWDMTNLYASITNTWKAIKTDFILKNSNTPTRLRFQTSFTGLTYNPTTGELTSIADGLVWGYIKKPYGYDANGSEDNHNITINQTYNGTYIEWSVDTTGATFPIYVDPPFSDGYGEAVNTAKDTFIQTMNDGHYNYGAHTAIKTYMYNNTHYSKGLIEFDLSSIPGDSSCTSATLYLYETYDNNTSGTINLYSIAVDNEAWIEGTGTGAADAAAGQPCWNALAADGAGGVTTAWHGTTGLRTSGEDYEADVIGTFDWLAADSEGHEYIIDLTPARVEGWFDTPNTNYGLLIQQALAAAEKDHQIASSDHGTTGYRPKLVIEYTESEGNIRGSTSWGQTDGVQEGNVRTFSGNWTGNGFVSGSGNYEKLYLSSTAYMESEIVNTGANSIDLYQNKYSAGDTGVLKYRSGSTVIDCQEAAWQTYSGSFSSLGYTQVRVEGS